MNRRRLRNHRHAVLAVIVLALTVAPTAPASANDPLVRAVARDASGVTVDVRVGDVAIKRDGARDAVSIPGASVVGREGWPIVPSMTRLVAVPGGARVLVAVEHVAFAEYQDVDLAPQPRLVTDLQADPAAAADPIAYTQNEWFPANLASVERVGSWRGVETARLTLGIAQYNAAKRRLRVATELRVRVSWDGGTVASIDAAHARAMSAALLNAPAPDGAANAPAPGADTNVLIVVQDTYGDSPSVAELVSLYEGDGLTVEVEKIGDIGALEGTALKAHIQSVYDAATPPQLAGVVFVGDAGPGKIPVAEGPTGFTSDWPYAFLDGDDQLADIVVGRFPAANEDELALMVQKTIDWRAGENAGDYLGTAVLIAHKQGYPEKYTAVSEQIRTRTYALAAPSFSTQYGGEDATNATLTSEIDAGRMIVNYRGHGDAWSWLTWSSTSEFYKAEQVAGLANEDRPAIVFAVACDNADVTQSARSFGEAWMTRDGGATALVGAVHSSYTVPNHDFNRFLFESIYDDGVATLGDVLALANARLLAFYAADPVYRQYAEANVDMYIWLGDPFLKLPVEPAKAPSNFRAEPIDTSSVSLSWNDFVDGEDGFDVEESAEPAGPWSVAASLAAGATGYTRTGLAEAESRYFRAVSVIGGERHPSAVAKAQSLAVPPDNLSAAPLGTQSLRVAWRDNSNGETGYRVMLREEGKTDFVFAALAGADAESAEAGGLAEATRYDALVEAVTA
ncbi:hypothetical protein K8I61_16940, partial [bacterium]|nr:hypothetical protein [bacterium]